MKTPRIEDFDPNAAPQLGSPMDHYPVIEKKPPRTEAPPPVQSTPLPVTPTAQNVPVTKRKTSSSDTTIPSHRDTTVSSNHDTTIPRYRDTTLELVRKAVKEFGKEAATHRFTVEEKKALTDLIYTFRQQGMRTSENEIARIAINFIFQDFKESGKESVLARVLRRLNE